MLAYHVLLGGVGVQVGMLSWGEGGYPSSPVSIMRIYIVFQSPFDLNLRTDDMDEIRTVTTLKWSG